MLPDPFSGNRRNYLMRLLANGIGQATVTVVAAFATQRIFQVAMTASDSVETVVRSITAPATGFIIALALLAWLRRRERIDAEWLGQDFVSDIRVRIFDHLTRLSLRAHGGLRKGAIMLRLVNDLTALRQWVSLGVARLVVSGILLSGAFGGLIVLSPYVGSIVTTIMLLGAGLIIVMGWRLDVTLRRARHRRGRLAANLGEKLDHIPTTNAFARRRDEHRKIRKLSRRLARAMVQRAASIGAMRAVTQLVLGIAGAAALIGGAFGQVSGMAEPGDIVAAMTVIAMMNAPLAGLGRVYEYWRSARIAREKACAILKRGPQIMQPTRHRRFDADTPQLTFHKVSVTGSIERLNAHVAFGSRIVLAGPNGSGKSTVLHLASRLIEPDAGIIKIGGCRIDEIGLGALRRTVSIFSSDIPLLRGTIASNICYRRSTNAADLEMVSRTCGLEIENPAHALYLHRKIQEGGTNLSYGERARVMLARALHGSPAILLLDEADAHLDPTSFDILRKVFATFRGTVMAVTHDPELQGLADQIWRINGGRLIATDHIDAPKTAVKGLVLAKGHKGGDI